MRRLKRRIMKCTATGVALAAVIGAGTAFGAAVPVNVMAEDSIVSQSEDIDIKSITFDKSTVAPGDTVTMNIDPTKPDDIKSVYVRIIGETDSIVWNGDFSVRPDDDGRLSYDLKIDNSYYNENYGIYFVRVFKADNYRDYMRVHSGNGLLDSPLRMVEFYDDDRWVTKVYDDFVIEAGEFTVTDSKEKYLGPKLKSVKFDSDVYKKGDVIKITAELLNPESDVESIIITFGYRLPTGEGSYTYEVVLKPGENSNWVGEIEVPEEPVEALWDEVYGGSPTFIISEAAVINGNEVMYYSDEFAISDKNISNIDTNHFVIDLTAEQINYSNIEGDGAVYTLQSGAPLEFVFKRSADDDKTFAHFTGVNVDGKALSDSDYTASEGSVNVKLQPEFLETLAVGEHDLTALFDDGNDVNVKFTITENKEQREEPVNQPDNTPQEPTSPGNDSQTNATEPASENEQNQTEQPGLESDKQLPEQNAEGKEPESTVESTENLSNNATAKQNPVVTSKAAAATAAPVVSNTAAPASNVATTAPTTGDKNHTPIWIAAAGAAAAALAGVVVRRKKKTEDR